MIKYTLNILLLFCVAFSTKAQELIELPMPKSDAIVMKLMFRNGSMADPTGKEGLTSLTARMMVEGGTKEMTAKEITDLTFPMAARYGVSVDKEVTIFTFSIHSDFLEPFYKLAMQLITNPGFREADFKRIKSNQQNYVDQVIRASSDEDYSKKALENMLFRGTPYAHMEQGYSSSVSKLTLEDVNAHFKSVFSSTNVSIGMAGNYPQGFGDRIKKDLQALGTHAVELPSAPKVYMRNGIQIDIIAKPNTLGSAIFTGFPLPINRSSDEFAALMVANSYFGEHRKAYSLLYKKLREQRSMNYGAYSYIEWYDNGGSNMLPPPGVPRQSNYFSMWIRPIQTAASLKSQYKELANISTGHAHFAIRISLRELDNLVENGMSKEDFELTRSFLRSYIKLYPQNTSARLGYLMDSKFYGRSDYLAEMDILLAKLTVEDVNKAIATYLQKETMYIAIVTDESEAVPLKDALLSNQPSPMSYSDDLRKELPKNILDEDEDVAVYPINVQSVRIIKSDEMFQ